MEKKLIGILFIISAFLFLFISRSALMGFLPLAFGCSFLYMGFSEGEE